jgi:hypothetical protein
VVAAFFLAGLCVPATSLADDIISAFHADALDASGNPLDVSSTHVLYNRTTGVLSLTARFHRAAPQELSGSSLTFWVSSDPRQPQGNCFDSRVGDFYTTLDLSSYFDDGNTYTVRGGGAGKPIRYAFSSDRRSLSFQVVDPGLVGRDLRCVDGASDTSFDFEAYDSLGPFFFGLPLKKIQTRRFTRRGKRFARPGHTKLKIRSAALAHVAVTVRRHGRRVVRETFQQPALDAKTLRFN